MRLVASGAGPLAVPQEIPEDAVERLADGRYERSILEAVWRVVHADDVLVEAGAGVGYTALRLRELAREVWSVEADPNYWSAARSNLRDTSNVHLLHGALALHGGRTTFYRAGDYRGSSARDLAGLPMRVPAVCLPDLIAQVHASTLVLDVEGSEVELLQEPAVLDPLRALVVEWHHEATSPLERAQALAAIFAAGFQVAWYADEQTVAAYRRRWGTSSAR